MAELPMHGPGTADGENYAVLDNRRLSGESPSKSLLIASMGGGGGEEAGEEEAGTVASAGEREEEEGPATSPCTDEEVGGVAVLTTFNADRWTFCHPRARRCARCALCGGFFLDETHAAKAVLFTRKAGVPSLWRSVAHARSRDGVCSFAVVKQSEGDLLARFQITLAMLPKVIIFTAGKKHVFSGTADLEHLSAFVARASAEASVAHASSVSSSSSSASDDWQALDLGDGADSDPALQPGFMFRRQDGMQVMRAGKRVPASMRKSLWSRKGGVLEMVDSTRKADVASALMLQCAQNSLTHFRELVNGPIVRVAERLHEDMALGSGEEGRAQQGMQRCRDAADAMLMDGRLAYPREDGGYLEAFLHWNHSGLSQLRANSLQAGVQPAVIEEFDRAIAEVHARLREGALTRAADMVLEAAVGGSGEGEGEGEGLGVSQRSRLRELVQASLLMRRVTEINKELGCLGGDWGDALAAQASHAHMGAEHLIDGAMCGSGGPYGVAGARAAAECANAGSGARVLLRGGGLEEGLLHVLGEGGASAGHGTYHAAVFNCYLVRRAGMHAQSSRHQHLVASFACLQRCLRQLAFDSLPAARTEPSPFAPLCFEDAPR